MLLKADATAQKLRGGYYTPTNLADFLTRYFASDNTIKTILEPSCGDGVFLESIVKYFNPDNIDYVKAYEIFDEEAEKARRRVANRFNIDVINGDFIEEYFKLSWEKPFDLIIGNPPYIRYQYLSERQRELQSQILVSHGMKANKLINSWVCFLVACIQLLSESGKICFIVPAELLQVAYAEDLRLFMANTLSRITLITFEELVFDEAEQEIIVLIGEKSKEYGETLIGVKQLKNLDSLNFLDLRDIEYIPLTHTKDKWTKYFTHDYEVDLIEVLRNDDRFITFDDIGIVNIGITTGNNKYFSVDKSTVEKYELSNVTIPLIGRSAHAHGVYFTYDDWMKNVNDNKRAFLVHFPSDIPYEEYPPLHKKYIEEGEKAKINEGYKCSIRDRWYIVPSVWVPDAFILRRNDKFPKFVLNNINAVSTDTMHRIKFNDGIDKNKVLLSYYNSITFAFTEINGRSYGGGVLEILPREVGKIKLPYLQDFDDKKTEELISIIDKNIRNNGNIEEVLDIVDKEVLIDYLGLDKEVCMLFRNIWKKLMKRRRDRSR
ncbi:Eco57I restriction-modification methylase domain-containing protein [Lutispora thermophila]|uniref:site-specific DNA-methyltransferase (adenine-specific) n=1 Tax=Lutispora thermophila DSM 19022 TaxID=1122184 RepID=A0A1M6J9M0_9FIRM|nr:class I SAM-dependent methyltransferase [Lutispora thermophila]SHJ43354.1 adenine-specific DNA-methyltransferase [Lutispora thermophila DSM 19022]